MTGPLLYEMDARGSIGAVLGFSTRAWREKIDANGRIALDGGNETEALAVDANDIVAFEPVKARRPRRVESPSGNARILEDHGPVGGYPDRLIGRANFVQAAHAG